MLISRPKASRISLKKFINQFVTDNHLCTIAEVLQEYVGRICYNSYDKMDDMKSTTSFLTSASKKGHRSVFEFGNLQVTYFDNEDNIDSILKHINKTYINIQEVHSHGNNSSLHGLIIHGSPRALMEIIEDYALGEKKICAIFIVHLLSKLSKLQPIMVENWETIKTIDAVIEPIVNLDDKLDDAYMEIVDVTEHVDNSDHCKHLFKIVADKNISLQFMRHRPCSYLQLSQRYVKVDNINICLSEKQESKLLANNDAGNFFNDSIKTSFASYNMLLNNNIRKEDARTVLPSCTTTEFFVYATKKQLLHIIKMRNTSSAYEPLRIIANDINKAMVPYL
jgi:thymidylate synthase (FAD)